MASKSKLGGYPKITPLIPENRAYKYKPAPMARACATIVNAAAEKKVRIDLPQTPHATSRLVTALCKAAAAKLWTPECEKALAECLPVREHHRAFMSHNTFVMAVGATVMKALEQATRGMNEELDLLADRTFVANIVCHDISKVSPTEAAAYSGIMAVHMEQTDVAARVKKRAKKKPGSESTESTLEKLYEDPQALTTPMANFGFRHHYELNPHHPEHFPGCEIDDMCLVEAIVDGLACIFERNNTHTDVNSWIDMYHVNRFNEPIKDLAVKILKALKTNVTAADYKALVDLRRAVFSIYGESPPWSRVIVTDSCCYGALRRNACSQRDLNSCFGRADE